MIALLAAVGASRAVAETVPSATDAVLHDVRARAERRIASIRATPNASLPADAAAYYLSARTGDDAADGRTPATAWRTVDRLNRAKIARGSFVLFERGGLYRGSVEACAGVTYTAYGEGPKPRLYGSPENGADPAKWTRTENPNVWSYEIGHRDVGTLVFDDGARHATKIVYRTDRKTGERFNVFTGRPFNSYRDLDGDLHFWHDYYEKGTGRVYLYSAENPGKRFRSIEFNVKCSGFNVETRPDVTIDNFTVKHVGIHGVAAQTCRNLTVSNCEFGWIGGSIQAEGLFGRDHPTRYGNGVEIYGGCDGYVVTNCYVWQVYDAGVTHQFNIGAKKGAKRFDQRNVRYVGNVIEKCNYSIEYFLTVPEGNLSRMENVVMEDNLMFDAGLGFCEQRPDLSQAAHIKAWYNKARNRAKNFVIRNNVFCGAVNMIVQICAGLRNEDGSSSLPTLADNVFIGAPGCDFGMISEKPCTHRVFGPDTEAFVNTFGRGNRCLFAKDAEGRYAAAAGYRACHVAPLRAVARRVRALAPSCAEGFWFLTDLHIKANSRQSGKLLAELSHLTPINRVLCGGDFAVAFGKGFASDRAAIDYAIDAYREDWVKPLRAAGCRLYTAKGNHDFTICHSYDTPADRKRGYTYGGEKAREIIVGLACERDIRTNGADPTACYYFVDNPAAKVRYVVADTTDSERAGDHPWAVISGMHATQLRWLAREAFGTVPSGYDVVVMNHIPVTGVVGTAKEVELFTPLRTLLEAYQNRGVFVCEGETFDFAAAKGRIVLNLTGHHHGERVTFRNGILHVTNPCDAAYVDYIDGSAPWCGELPQKKPDTAAEQTFDAVQFDRVRELVHFTRVGGGQNRTIHLQPLRAEPGVPLKLTPQFVKGPVTWGCYDADAVTFEKHPTRRFGSVIRYHNELATVGADGTLLPTKPGEIVVLAMDRAFNKEIFSVVCRGRLKIGDSGSTPE